LFFLTQNRKNSLKKILKIIPKIPLEKLFQANFKEATSRKKWLIQRRASAVEQWSRKV